MYNISRYFDTYFETVVASGFKTKEEAKEVMTRMYKNTSLVKYYVKKDSNV